MERQGKITCATERGTSMTGITLQELFYDNGAKIDFILRSMVSLGVQLIFKLQ